MVEYEPQAIHHKTSESMGDDNSKEPSACLREEHDKEEDRQRMEEHSSSSLTLDGFLSVSPTPLSSSLYSSMQQDDFDEAEPELIARAKRCEEIMKLSQQAIDAEAARVNAANIKPLVWAKPAFEIDSPAADTATDDVAAVLTRHKQKSQVKPQGKRMSTREEVQAFVEFTDKWMPSAKRRSTSGNDDEGVGIGRNVWRSS
ncbi:hypothetical protein QTG54_015755 [Skeletonema marinoi]|uniref:Uncharacterized protein n=1 Tax=Skeletonema marinoi TaxID=267567 RepID=A0AAD8XU76_9STRA|nr:hypothetical protein QTG54_015755 [Skeletonema marinoi]